MFKLVELRLGAHTGARRFVAVAVGLALVSTVVVAPVASADDPTSSVLFVVDTSGSMAGTPLTQATAALHVGIDALGQSQAAGLRTFAGGCGDPGTLVVPVAGGNRDALNAAADRLCAGGGTPTPDALRAAAGDLPLTGDRTIVLISDGQSGCGDPCVVAAELKSQLGIDFRVHAVGFNAPNAAETELSCIASVTGGRYFTATNTSDLSAAITNAVTTGTGTVKPGIVCSAPTFIGVRGSGENPSAPTLAQYRAGAAPTSPYLADGVDALGMGPALAAMFNFMQRQPSVNFDFNVMSVAYPAVPVGFTLPYALGDYRDSVSFGAVNLERIIQGLTNKCGAGHRIVLGGYSQGANVINRYLVDHASAPQGVGSIKSVVYFGDPNARPGRPGERQEGTAAVPFGSVALGIVEGDANIEPFLRSRRDVVSSFCLANDIVCNPLPCTAAPRPCNPGFELALGLPIHTSYASPLTLVTCPVDGTVGVPISQCAALRIMRDLGYPVAASSIGRAVLEQAQKVIITLGGWLANIPGSAIFASDPQVVGNFTTDENGNAAFTVEIPADAALGDHHLIVKQGPRTASMPISVSDAGTTGDQPVVSFGPFDAEVAGPKPGPGGSTVYGS